MFVDPIFIPLGLQLKEPTSMTKDDIDKFLDFWRARQREASGPHTFRFRRCSSKGKQDTYEGVVYDCDKGKSRSLSQGPDPPEAAVVDNVFGRTWDEEYDAQRVLEGFEKFNEGRPAGFTGPIEVTMSAELHLLDRPSAISGPALKEAGPVAGPQLYQPGIYPPTSSSWGQWDMMATANSNRSAAQQMTIPTQSLTDLLHQPLSPDLPGWLEPGQLHEFIRQYPDLDNIPVAQFCNDLLVPTRIEPLHTGHELMLPAQSTISSPQREPVPDIVGKVFPILVDQGSRPVSLTNGRDQQANTRTHTNMKAVLQQGLQRPAAKGKSKPENKRVAIQAPVTPMPTAKVPTPLGRSTRSATKASKADVKDDDLHRAPILERLRKRKADVEPVPSVSKKAKKKRKN